MNLDQKRDWLNTFYAWSDHMRIECASLGYDLEAGRKASSEYLRLSTEYKEKWGEDFMSRSYEEVRDARVA